MVMVMPLAWIGDPGFEEGIKHLGNSFGLKFLNYIEQMIGYISPEERVLDEDRSSVVCCININ